MTWLSEIHEQQDELTYVAGRLNQLANNFLAVGNEKIAEELLELGWMIKTVSENLNETTSQKLSDDLKQAQRATGNMISAALAIATRDK